MQPFGHINLLVCLMQQPPMLQGLSSFLAILVVVASDISVRWFLHVTLSGCCIRHTSSIVLFIHSCWYSWSNMWYGLDSLLINCLHTMHANNNHAAASHPPYLSWGLWEVYKLDLEMKKGTKFNKWSIIPVLCHWIVIMIRCILEIGSGNMTQVYIKSEYSV